jgi:hypothetical protein
VKAGIVLALLLAGAQAGDDADVAALARKSVFALTPAERRREMALLGIEALRPGRNGFDMRAPNAVNYEEARAEPRRIASDVLGGAKTADDWWTIRRPSLVRTFGREMYGRVPDDLPEVTWRVGAVERETIGGIAAETRHLIGHVDNSGAPGITVDIDAVLTLPANATGAVPVMINLSWVLPPKLPEGFTLPPEPPGPDWKTQILTRGWGYVVYDPLSVQPDNGAGLTQGIIGLANRGAPRSLDDWGVLRAWAWGASRILDYLERDLRVAADKVGVAGHSRYGKAALVAEAFDRRFAIGYISSSGAGGAKLLWRDYGEQLENLTSDEYYWFAGNFMRYGADPRTVYDLPVDADALIALCAPRPVFISAGTQAAGDGWVDPRGSFEAAAGASAAYELLGTTGLSSTAWPPTGTPVTGGRIGFRQHAYGHTQAANWPTFLDFAGRAFAAARAH